MSTRAWIGRLALAEGVGMLAAATAARAGTALQPHPHGVGDAATLVVLAVAGGLVEGSALGLATGVLLRRMYPALALGRWTALTTLVAALGWAAGSLPAALSPGGSEPGVAMVLAGAAAVGLLMGGLLGVAQSLLLRGVVRHPGRWAVGNAWAWPPAMVVIFVGATVPNENWPTAAVIAVAAPTGLLAGALLGAALRPFAATLTGTSLVDRVVLAVMTTRWRRHTLPGSLVGLAVRGPTTGVWHRFPVMAATDGGAVVVVPGHPDTKSWWRPLERPQRVLLCRYRRWEAADAWLLRPGEPGHAESLAAYRRDFSRAVPDDTPLVRIVPLAARDADRPRRARTISG